MGEVQEARYLGLYEIRVRNKAEPERLKKQLTFGS